MGFRVEEHLIVAAENALERRLPDALRERLLRNNGGEIEAVDDDWTLHPVADTSDRKRAGRTASDVVRETMQARDWPGFPVSAIAIANNGTGDLLILRAGSDSIELWDHESEECTPVEINW